jgi:hypothetical protein
MNNNNTTLDGEGNGFKLKVSEWRGYVGRALEDINEETKDINNKIDTLRKEDLKEVKDDIKEIQKQLTLLRVKVATIGAAAGTLTSILTLIISKLITG